MSCLLFLQTTTRCPHRTDRGLSLAPEPSAPCLLQVGAAGRRNFSSLPLCGKPERQAGERQRGWRSQFSWHPVKRHPSPRLQTNPGGCLFLKRFSRKCFTWSFPSDGESLEFGRGKAQRGDASNGERLNQPIRIRTLQQGIFASLSFHKFEESLFVSVPSKKAS